VYECREYPRTAGAERVAECDGATVDVDSGAVELQIADAREGLRGKRFVQLYQIELAGRDAGPSERLSCGGYRAESHTAGIDTRNRRRDDFCHRLQPKLIDCLTAHD
jgi:hypothetical protein